MRLIVQETYLVNIPQTDDYEDAVAIFHTDSTDLYEVKHYGYDFKNVSRFEDLLEAEEEINEWRESIYSVLFIFG